MTVYGYDTWSYDHIWVYRMMCRRHPARAILHLGQRSRLEVICPYMPVMHAPPPTCALWPPCAWIRGDMPMHGRRVIWQYMGIIHGRMTIYGYNA